MINNIRLAALAGLIFAIASPALGGGLTPQPAPQQRLISGAGKPITVSTGERGEVGLALVEQRVENRGGAPLFFVTVTNATGGEVRLTAADVVATAGAQSVRVLTLAELATQARADTESELNGARARASGAVQSTGGPLVEDATGGRQTSQVVGMTAITSGRNAPSGFGSLAGAARNTRDADRRFEDRGAVADQLGFRDLTLAAGQHASTPILLSPLPRGATSLTLVVTLAGEAHTFSYSITP